MMQLSGEFRVATSGLEYINLLLISLRTHYSYFRLICRLIIVSVFILSPELLYKQSNISTLYIHC